MSQSVLNVPNNLPRAFYGSINDSTTTTMLENATSASPPIATIDPLVKSVFERQQAARQSVIAKSLINQSPKVSEKPSDLHVLYHGLVPEVICARLVRIGNVDDGGKWLCDPWSLPKKCIVYSFGVGGDNTFERELDQLLQTRCSTWSFDNNPMFAHLFTGLNQSTFRPWLIGRTTNSSANIYAPLDIMKQFGHSYIDILKIDIETSEYEVVPELLAKITSSNTTFCQVLIELHGLASKQTPLLQKFAQADYLLYSYELNGFDHSACEYSFVHRTCMNQYGMYEVLQRNFAT